MPSLAELFQEPQMPVVQSQDFGSPIFLDEDFKPSTDYSHYALNIAAYFKEVLGITLWSGENGTVGQLELALEIDDSIRRQLDGEKGVAKEWALESANGLGKTYFMAGLAQYIGDCFEGSGTIHTAPNESQLELLWGDLRNQRKHEYGHLYPKAPKLEYSPVHYIIGRVTSDSGGQGAQRAHGRHRPYMCFLVDEAEAVPSYMFSAIRGMMTGCSFAIAVYSGNPAGTYSAFAKVSERESVRVVRLSTFNYPNVVHDDAQLIPGGTNRDWVDQCIDDWAEETPVHNDDELTFSVPWRTYEGTPIIYKPVDPQMLWRVQGIRPPDYTVNTFLPLGRYEAATQRLEPAEGTKNRILQFGVDAARFGNDKNVSYALLNGRLHFVARIAHGRGKDICTPMLEFAKQHEGEYDAISFRVDGTGGFGATVSDTIQDNKDFAFFHTYKLSIHEVHFGSNAHDQAEYYDFVSEMYAETAEVFKGIALVNPSSLLKADLCQRRYSFGNKAGVSLKKAEEKTKFRDRIKKTDPQHKDGRSPDDGDAAVLACSPEFMFEKRRITAGALSIDITE